MVYLGALFIATSLMIMYGLVRFSSAMSGYMPVETWYVASVLLAPCGYVLQDAVADAMSVDAVPKRDAHGTPLDADTSKALHTTMQTLGRIALISGLVAVALVNIFMFAGVEQLSQSAKTTVYGRIYLAALIIPVISISGVMLAAVQHRRQRAALAARGIDATDMGHEGEAPTEATSPNFWYFGGGAAFVALTLVVGLGGVPYAQEIVFTGSMAIVVALMLQLSRQLDPVKARALFGTAIIIFVFRAVPLPGPGATWFEIDVLELDQQFISVLTLITSVLTLAGMIVLRPLIASRSIVYIVVLLTLAAAVLSLPNIGLFYGLHEWTAPMTNGVVDARFIAIIDTAIESPLGQIAMIPMLAWIARNAPNNLKATFFAVMASFTNLALSASSLLTNYLNQIFVVTREVRNRETDAIEVGANYDWLGVLLITVTIISLLAPLVTIVIVQRSLLRTDE